MPDYENWDEEPSTNQLQVIVQESGLEETKAKYILNKFQDYFTMADEWAKQTKTIVVTDAKQTDMMKLARAGRLALREKRLAIEKSRKELKEQSLREGKAIDGIANVLKALIIPIEEYLEKQEKFVEFQESVKAEVIRLEVEKKMEEERIAKEKADVEERDRIYAENERLRKEAMEKDRLAAIERKRIEDERMKERRDAESKRLEAERKARDEQEKIKKDNEAKIAKERVEQQAKLDLVRKEQEAKLDKERAEREKIESELRAKKQAEMKAEAERIRKELELANAGDAEKLWEFRKAVEAIKIPDVNSPESMRIISDAKSHLYLAISKINPTIMEDF
jgi:hypothetical protein